MVGNSFVVLTILPGLHTSFHWAALAKAYKQLWKDFVVTILCAVHVADAFGSRSPLTTTKVMSTPLSTRFQEQVRAPASVSQDSVCVMQHMYTHSTSYTPSWYATKLRRSRIVAVLSRLHSDHRL